MTSQARIDANRKNAQNSTGPTSRTGKDRSKMNRLTHGLRAAEVVLPTEDPAAFQAHMDAWMADWDPPTMVRRELVEKMAVGAWRRKRLVRVESQRLSDRVNAAFAASDRRERAAVDRDVKTLFDDPKAGLKALLASRAGVARVMEMWAAIFRAAIEPGYWFDPDAQHQTFLALMGLDGEDSDDESRATVGASWRLLLHDRPEVDPEGFVPLDDEEAASVRDQIARVAGERLNRLAAIQTDLPDRSAERSRHAELAAFDPRPEDALLLRYEGQIDREFHRSLGALTGLARSGADLVDDAPNEPNPAVATAEAATDAPAPNEPNGSTENSGDTMVMAENSRRDDAGGAVSRNKANRPETEIPCGDVDFEVAEVPDGVYGGG